MKATKSQSEENRKRYNKITKEIKKKAKRCKEKWLEEKCSKVENSARVNNTGKLFQMVVGQICGTVSPRMSTVKDKAGKSLENKKSSRGGNNTMKSCTTKGTQWIVQCYRSCQRVTVKNKWMIYSETKWKQP